MKIVYVVSLGNQYDGFCVEGVFSTHSKAKRWCKENRILATCKEEYASVADRFIIEKWEINKEGSVLEETLQWTDGQIVIF